MSYGHWLKRDFYLRSTKKPFGHYQKVYGNDVPKREAHSGSEAPKPSMLQHIATKGIGVGVVLAMAILMALAVVNGWLG